MTSNRLPVIEAEVRTEHDACGAAAQTSIEHAIKAGQLLEEAKALLKHGKWLPWLADNCGLSERTAQRYMRLARNAAKSDSVADLNAAERLLSTTGLLDLDLSCGAIGQNRNGVFIRIEPCGQHGIYARYCHIIVTRCSGNDDDDGTYTRTLEGVHESEIVAWLRQKGGVDVDALEWWKGAWEPKPDTYRLERLLSSVEERERT